MLNLVNVKYVVKTTYAGRKSETPLFSITKAGSSSLNTAFTKTYLRGFKRSVIYTQLILVKSEYYLLVSKTKRASFYSFTLNGNGTSKNYSSTIQGFITALGKKGIAMRYSLEKIETNDKTIMAFKLKNVAEDLFTSKEDSNFEVHK
jgi:hypothetical protein